MLRSSRETINKVIFTKSGQGRISTKLSVPKSFLTSIGITEDEKDVRINLEGNQIIITKQE